MSTCPFFEYNFFSADECKANKKFALGTTQKSSFCESELSNGYEKCGQYINKTSQIQKMKDDLKKAKEKTSSSNNIYMFDENCPYRKSKSLTSLSFVCGTSDNEIDSDYESIYCVPDNKGDFIHCENYQIARKRGMIADGDSRECKYTIGNNCQADEDKEVSDEDREKFCHPKEQHETNFRHCSCYVDAKQNGKKATTLLERAATAAKREMQEFGEEVEKQKRMLNGSTDKYLLENQNRGNLATKTAISKLLEERGYK